MTRGLMTTAGPGPSRDRRTGGCVLVVEDDSLVAVAIGMTIEDFGYGVCGTAATVGEALALAERSRPAVVLMDVRLGREDGIAAAALLQARHGAAIIFLTGATESDVLTRLQTIGPAAVLIKPILPNELHRILVTVIGPATGAAIDHALRGPHPPGP